MENLTVEAGTFGNCKDCNVPLEMYNRAEDSYCEDCYELHACMNCGLIDCECD